METLPIGHLDIKDRKFAGAHYTPNNLAKFVASQIFESISTKILNKNIRILDPAIGDGELILSLIDIFKTNNISNFEVFGFDTDYNALDFAKSRINQFYPEIKINLRNLDFIELIQNEYDLEENNLFSNNNTDLYDIIISNPPYVRTQIMGSLKSKNIAKTFNLTGRVDLYHAFLVGISKILSEGAIAGIIVSNRFLSTKTGCSIRNIIRNNFKIIHLWDLGDTKIFEAAVLPAVLLVKKEKLINSNNIPKFTSVYSTESTDIKGYANDIFESLNMDGIIKIVSGKVIDVKQGVIDFGESNNSIWKLSNYSTDSWLETIKKNTYCLFGDINHIRVGIKTCADKVFIKNNWNELEKDEQPEEELLKPLITHHIANRFKTEFPLKKVLYPHISIEGKRSTIDIENYPRAYKYLLNNRANLEKRTYVLEAGRKWYELWVPQDPESWIKPKLVFWDIAEKPTFWIDFDGSIVNGDCYWLSCDDDNKIDLLWLALAVGNSSFIETFYDNNYNNKLYAGRRRFISQYVEKFPLPDPSTNYAKELINISKYLYDNSSFSEVLSFQVKIDKLVLKCFGLDIEEVPR